jgi:hypothetical protein
VLLQAQVDKLIVDSNNLQKVVDVQIEKGFKANYKIATLKEHLKMEKANKDKFLDKLSKLSNEAFTFRHQQDI